MRYRNYSPEYWKQERQSMQGHGILPSMALVIDQLPRFSTAEAEKVGVELYGIACRAEELPSERDQNFYLEVESGDGYVLKIANAAEDRDVLDAQNKAMERVAEQGESVRCPRVRATISGRAIAAVLDRTGREHLVRLVTWIPGTTFAEAKPHPPHLLQSLGGFLGRLDEALDGFSHPAARRTFYWDLQEAAGTVAGCIDHIPGQAGRSTVERFLARFESHVLPRFPELRTSVIHNDANDHNILVSDGTSSPPTVIGIIDFGDMVESHTVFNLAVGAAYGILGERDPIAAAAHIVGGYHETFPLDDVEMELLYDLISMRLCMSVSISAQQQKQNPANAYLTVSERPAWETLNKLSAVDPDRAIESFQDACKTQP